ncbi:hypothetical protein ACFQ0D_35915, partial [Micromonospora zhanjiangensis]
MLALPTTTTDGRSTGTSRFGGCGECRRTRAEAEVSPDAVGTVRRRDVRLPATCGRIRPGFGHGVADWVRQVGAGHPSPLAVLGETVEAVRGLVGVRRVSLTTAELPDLPGVLGVERA